jgi:hypothetical protein
MATDLTLHHLADRLLGQTKLARKFHHRDPGHDTRPQVFYSLSRSVVLSAGRISQQPVELPLFRTAIARAKSVRLGHPDPRLRHRQRRSACEAGVVGRSRYA